MLKDHCCKMSLKKFPFFLFNWGWGTAKKTKIVPNTLFCLSPQNDGVFLTFYDVKW